MSIMFCTPAYGGQVTTAYFQSCLALQESMLESEIEFDFLTLLNESLITRGRNVCVGTFLASNFEYLMFIDADIGFGVNDVKKLYSLNADIAVGAYPMKREDKILSVWKDDKHLEYNDSIAEVDYAGTGFMLIKRSVFEGMILNKRCQVREYEEGGKKFHDFFKTGIHNGIYESEDFNFCRVFREKLQGIITVDLSIRLQHWGTHCYSVAKP